MWPRWINIAMGIWLMAAPAVLGTPAPGRINDRIAGPIIAAIATIAIWEVTRPLRWLNVLAGAWLLVAPWILNYQDVPDILNSSLSGLIVMGAALVKGPIRERFGGGWSTLWKS